MKTNNQFHYLIAANVFDSSKTRVLLEIKNNADEETAAYNFDEFVGGGYEICHCLKTESLDSAADSDELIEMTVGEASWFFKVENITETFPLVEGDFVAGIYELDSDDHSYFEVKDLPTLSRVYYSIFQHAFLTEEFKIVCSEDFVCLISLPENQIIEKVKRRPLTFFDVLCPLCQQQVMTYEINSNEYPECLPIDVPCPHFIGSINYSGGYEKEALQRFNMEYQLNYNNLYFKTEAGIWEEAFRHIPTPSSDSYWNCLDEENPRYSEDQILFIEAGRQLDSFENS